MTTFKSISRNVNEVLRRVYPKSKRCLFCPLEKRLCAVDDLCPCPWRNTKVEIANVIIRFKSNIPPKIIRKNDIFNVERF